MISEDQRPSVIVVGGGASGVLAAAHILRAATGPLSVTVVEPDSDLGRGVAYGTHTALHVLNVRADNMSAYPEDPEHFLRYARGLPEGAGLTPETFAPRTWYAGYLRATLDEAARQAPAVRLMWRRATAVGLRQAGGRADVELDDGTLLAADHVVLALGNPPPGSPLPGGAQGAMISGFDTVAVDRDVPDGAAVLLVGTGLTMVDVVLSLAARGHAGPIYAVSRHGLLPQPHQPRQRYPAFLPAGEPPPARELLRLVRREARAAREAGVPWQSVMDALRSDTQRIWRALPLAERRRFLRHIRPYWEVHRHRIPPQAVAVLGELRASGGLRVYAGRVAAYEPRAAGAAVELRLRHGGERVTLQVGAVVNCTGPASDYGALRHPLLESLRSQGLLRPDPLRLGLDCDAEGRLLGEAGPSALLSTLGPPQRGALWECTSVPDIRAQAAALALRITGR